MSATPPLLSQALAMYLTSEKPLKLQLINIVLSKLVYEQTVRLEREIESDDNSCH